MKHLTFYKYQGAGNDFILFDARDGFPEVSNQQMAAWCDRHFGIGADGVMLLLPPSHPGDQFYMQYHNADGNQSTMCGNGGRCIARFAADLGICGSSATFHAIDGPHWAEIRPESVTLGMIDAPAVTERQGGYFVNTGSPHHVEQTPFTDDFVSTARAKRHAYGPEGSNINHIELCGPQSIAIRTFERGVEDETLACGTGAVAAAMVAVAQGWVAAPPVQIAAQGGNLEVSFEGNGPFTSVWLKGPAEFVFKGTLEL